MRPKARLKLGAETITWDGETATLSTHATHLTSHSDGGQLTYETLGDRQDLMRWAEFNGLDEVVTQWLGNPTRPAPNAAS